MRIKCNSFLPALLFLCFGMTGIAVSAESVIGSAPPAFSACYERKDPGCIFDKDSAPFITETRKALHAFRRVNDVVNTRLRPLPPDRTYLNGPNGEENYWSSFKKPYSTPGNCVNYALTKRTELIGQGYPANALRLALVRSTEDSTQHLLLLVYTDQNTYVLDNIDWRIRTLKQVFVSGGPYTKIRLQGSDGRWHLSFRKS
jgi:predicted transglutaminase-like cysteine proteinase